MRFDPTKPFYAIDSRNPDSKPRTARIICDDMKSPHTTYVALVQHGTLSGQEELWFVGLDGEKSAGVNPAGNFLINIPETHERVLHLYQDPTGQYSEVILHGNQDAIAPYEHVASKLVSFTVGEFEG